MSAEFRNIFKNSDGKEHQSQIEHSYHDENEDYSDDYYDEPQDDIDILYSWEAPEFEVYEKSPQWYLIGGSFIIALVIYALVTNSPIMAITFILIGIIAYLQLQRDPQIVQFHITTNGIIIGREIYAYENIHSFWIFYDPPHTKTISLHTNASILPFVHIPINNEDPLIIREKLMEFMPEIEQQPSLIDNIERLLHI